MSATVGTPLDRVDGPQKVRGEARYAADFQLPRLAHAVILFSTIPAGTCAIDASAVREMPGVLLVMTPDNAPKLPDPNDVEPPATRALSLLQTNEVRYNGEPVALVVADTLERARAAALALEPHYTPKPAVLDFACLRRVGFHCCRFEKSGGLYPKKWRNSRELRRIHQRRRVEETYCIPARLCAPECCGATRRAGVSAKSL